MVLALQVEAGGRMTLILGIEDGDKAYVFGDRAVFRNGGGFVARLTEPKIWASNGWVIGACGDFDFCCAAQRIPAPQGDDLYPWIEEIYSRFGEMSSKFKGADSEAKPSSPGFIAARGGNVFIVEGMCVLRTTSRYGAVGAPWQFATGAMAALNGTYTVGATEPALFIGKEAMQAVQGVTDSMAPPFDWICTDGTSGAFGE